MADSDPPFTEKQMWEFIDMATEAAKNSLCDRSKVGATLAHSNGSVYVAWNAVEEGYGGLETCKEFCPRGARSYEEVPKETPFEGEGRCTGSHAEIQAIARAKEGFLMITMAATQSTEISIEVGPGFFEGWWMFTTREPCAGCRKVLEELGIRFLWKFSKKVTRIRTIGL